MNDTREPGATRAPRRARTRRRALLVGLASLVVVGAASAFMSAGVKAALSTSRRTGISDGATILALTGVREFTRQADIAALMLTPVGADSMLMKATVFAGDESTGMYVVRVLRVGHDAFRLRSTGRLASGGTSMVCNVDVFVQIDQTGGARPHLGVSQLPLCNGSRHDSPVTRFTHIGS